MKHPSSSHSPPHRKQFFQRLTHGRRKGNRNGLPKGFGICVYKAKLLHPAQGVEKMGVWHCFLHIRCDPGWGKRLTEPPRSDNREAGIVKTSIPKINLPCGLYFTHQFTNGGNRLVWHISGNIHAPNPIKCAICCKEYGSWNLVGMIHYPPDQPARLVLERAPNRIGINPYQLHVH